MQIQKTFFPYLAAAVLILAVNCEKPMIFTDKNTVPNTRPPDFTIEYKSYIGRLPTTSTVEILISEKESYYQKDSKQPFMVDKSQFDDLYNKLKGLNFSKIKSRYSKTMDRAGTVVTFYWNNRKEIIELNNFNSYFIEDRFKKDFFSITKAIETFAIEQINKP